MEIIITDKRENLDKELHPYDIAYKKKFTAHEGGIFANEITKKVFFDIEPNWYNVGKNHIVDGMKFSRDVDCEEMFINVDSAEDLFEYLKEQSGLITFGNYKYGDGISEIRIYDWH